jgi:hypothetical protein
MHTLSVFSHIFTYMCIFLRTFTYIMHMQPIRMCMCSMVATTVFFSRGPPTWCINLSTYGSASTSASAIDTVMPCHTGADWGLISRTNQHDSLTHTGKCVYRLYIYIYSHGDI